MFQNISKEFPDLKDKTTVIENILSPSFIKEQANVEISEEIRKKKETTVLVTVGGFHMQKD